jgi:hypothetical protein
MHPNPNHTSLSTGIPRYRKRIQIVSVHCGRRWSFDPFLSSPRAPSPCPSSPCRGQWKQRQSLTILSRLKSAMWAQVAEELQVPWRAAEAMHWQLGEAEMARRAGVTAFSLQPAAVDVPPDSRRQHYSRGHPSRGHAHSQSQGSGLPPGLHSPRYGRTPVPSVPDGYSPPGHRLDHGSPVHGHATGLSSVLSSASSRLLSRERLSPRHQQHQTYYPLPVPPITYVDQRHADVGLPPIQPSAQRRDPGILPGIAQITSGISGNSIPAYAASKPYRTGTISPNPFGNPPAPVSSAAYEPTSNHPTHSDTTRLADYSASGKRGPSPDVLEREPTRRRHHDRRLRQDYYEDRPGSGSSGGGSRHA